MFIRTRQNIAYFPVRSFFTSEKISFVQSNATNDDFSLVKTFSLVQNSYNNSHITNLIANDELTPVKVTDCNNTYAKAAARQTPPTKINQRMVTPKDTPPNHELLANIDDGVKGVERRRNRVKRFFLSGIAKSVTETNIRAYLEKRNVKPTQISIFKSRREGTVSAKINIPAGDAKLVNTNEFWPRFVQCKPWQHTYDKQSFDRRRNTTLKGHHNGTFV